MPKSLEWVYCMQTCKRKKIMPWSRTAAVLILALLTPLATAKETKPKTIQHETQAAYIQRMRQESPDLAPATPGSLWTDNGRFANLSADYKAMHVGDLITIVVAQGTTANNTASVSTARSLSASSGITALAGKLKTAGVENLFSPNSTATLSGKSQGTSTSALTDTMSGRVVAVLPSGVLVVEAERQLTMNNERQTILVRGLVRPGDITPGGTVLSNQVGNLELELKGKGVLSDGVRPPNALVRGLLWLVGF
jgi:flagellar L-ring protein FlgH